MYDTMASAAVAQANLEIMSRLLSDDNPTPSIKLDHTLHHAHRPKVWTLPKFSLMASRLQESLTVLNLNSDFVLKDLLFYPSFMHLVYVTNFVGMSCTRKS